MKRLISIIMALFLVFAAGCGTGGSSNGDGRQEIFFAASNTSGSFYQFCVPVCTLVNKYSDSIKLTPVTTSGTKESIDLMGIGEVDIVGGPGIMEYNAYKGTGPWSDSGSIDMTVAFSCYPDYLQIAVRRDSDINSLKDLNGAKISLNLQQSSADLSAQLLFETLGVTEYDAYYMDTAESASALQEGRVDAMIIQGGLGVSAFMELTASRSGMRLIPFTEEEVSLAEESSNGLYHRRVIPGGYYQGIDDDVVTIGGSVPVCVSGRVSEDTVYEIAKILFEHNDELTAAVSNAKYTTAEETVNEWSDSVIALNGGTLRYLQEAGLTAD